MIEIHRLIIAGALVIGSSLTFAQTNYEKIEVGSVLKAGIGLGSFTKPIPLPDGDWLVVSKRVEDISLTISRRSSSFSTPRIWLTLKNNQPDPLVFAMVMSFTPEAPKVSWGNGKCENSNPKVLTDDFGSTTSSLLYICSYASSYSGFRNRLSKAPESTNNWWKTNLTELAPYAKEFPDNVLWVDVFGNQHLGKYHSFAFLLKREGDTSTDAMYADHIKKWVHATGLSLGKVLENNAAELVLPTAYIAQP